MSASHKASEEAQLRELIEAWAGSVRAKDIDADFKLKRYFSLPAEQNLCE